jgi:hypothetical protein
VGELKQKWLRQAVIDTVHALEKAEYESYDKLELRANYRFVLDWFAYRVQNHLNGVKED